MFKHNDIEDNDNVNDKDNDREKVCMNKTYTCSQAKVAVQQTRQNIMLLSALFFFFFKKDFSLFFPFKSISCLHSLLVFSSFLMNGELQVDKVTVEVVKTRKYGGIHSL